ncbi:hypothetical protein [Pseudomonas sp. B21-021]|jgi:hypothetical protein|uniref:hypothetical protein n=1 Tax=Pseudomonas sp. B21-021 TaxID=2895476 RepID=UPI00215EA8DF|nr:hypothetical protein [Pseudomonas sp. B21-021]UVM29945.1 hypothetical protein LOY31_13035 [Pseudomonas sp. B21-021]
MTVHGRYVAKAFLFASATALIGCSTPYEELRFHGTDGGPAPEIVGIKQLLKINKQIDIMIIHGMCTHDSEWANKSIQGIAKQLAEGPVAPVTFTEVTGSKARVYKRSLLLQDNSKVNISAIVWSPILTPLKEGLCYDQSVKTGICAKGEDRPDFIEADISSPAFKETRASINRSLKDGLMDDCLADAIAYQGKAKEEISRQVQEAVLVAATPSENVRSTDEVRTDAAARKDIPLVIHTASLGSKVGFDALNSLRQQGAEGEAAARSTIQRTSAIFMSANQLPILQIADMSLTYGGAKGLAADVPQDSLKVLLETYGPQISLFQTNKGLPLGKQQPSDQPMVVVLSDPNDVLSYSLRNFKHRPDYVTVDVVVSNAPTWFGAFENPLKAHQDYLEQPNVVDLVVNGRKAD